MQAGTISSMATLSNGCANAPNAAMLPMYVRLKRYGIYWQRYCRERILVILDVSTGLRQSELFGLKWQDIDLEIGKLRVTRSVVGQVVGSCKTEASQKAIPLHEDLIEALKGWRQQNPYKEAQHWVFASPSSGGKNPYWGQQLMRRDIRPVPRSWSSPSALDRIPSGTRTRLCFCTLFGFREIGTTLLKRMAGTTRLELATSAVTGTIFW